MSESIGVGYKNIFSTELSFQELLVHFISLRTTASNVNMVLSPPHIQCQYGSSPPRSVTPQDYPINSLNYCSSRSTVDMFKLP